MSFVRFGVIFLLVVMCSGLYFANVRDISVCLSLQTRKGNFENSCWVFLFIYKVCCRSFVRFQTTLNTNSSKPKYSVLSYLLPQIFVTKLDHNVYHLKLKLYIHRKCSQMYIFYVDKKGGNFGNYFLCKK